MPTKNVKKTQKAYTKSTRPTKRYNNRNNASLARNTAQVQNQLARIIKAKQVGGQLDNMSREEHMRWLVENNTILPEYGTYEEYQELFPDLLPPRPTE